MTQPALRVVSREEKITLGFRRKTWNLLVNFVGCFIAMVLIILDLAIFIFLGIPIGLVTDRYPHWAKLSLTLWFIEDYGPRDGEWLKRPFYRKRPTE